MIVGPSHLLGQLLAVLVASFSSKGRRLSSLLVAASQLLDPPLVKVTGADTTKLRLEWPTIPNATGYTLEISPTPPQKHGPFSAQEHPTQTHWINGLTPGTSYLVSVTATGSIVKFSRSEDQKSP